MRKSEWLDHPNGAVGIESITVVLDDPSHPDPCRCRRCSAPPTDRNRRHPGGAHRARRPAADHTRWVEHAASGNGRSCRQWRAMLAALTLLVRDPVETAAELDRREIAYRRDAGGTIGVSPEHTHGVMLEFAAAGGVARAAARLA